MFIELYMQFVLSVKCTSYENVAEVFPDINVSIKKYFIRSRPVVKVVVNKDSIMKEKTGYLTTIIFIFVNKMIYYK